MCIYIYIYTHVQCIYVWLFQVAPALSQRVIRKGGSDQKKTPESHFSIT